MWNIDTGLAEIKRIVKDYYGQGLSGSTVS